MRGATNLPARPLIESLGDKEAADAIAAISDIALDKLIDAGALDGVPVVGAAVALVRLGKSISSRIYAKKVLTFLREIQPMTSNERQAFSEKLYASGEAERFAEALYLFLEKADEMGKPAILGRIVAGFVRDEFTLDDCQRLCLSVNRAFIADLRLMKKFRDGVQIDRERAEGLFSAGLLSNGGFDGGSRDDDETGGTIFVLNRYGKLLVALV